MRYLLLGLFLGSSCLTFASHKVKFRLESLEWNGLKKTYSPARAWDLEFTGATEALPLDTMGNNLIFFKISVLPVYHDGGFEYGFLMEMYDKASPPNKLETQTRWVQGSYEAGSSTSGPQGNRKWTGSIRYTPDTSIHYTPPSWRKDHYTLNIGSIQTWRNGKEVGNTAKNLLFEGHTGEKSYHRNLGRTGGEKITLEIEARRYAWGKQTWMELTMRYYAESEGKKVEFLAHTFKSTDKNILQINRDIHNAYEITDKRGNKSMVLMVKLIPY